MKRTAPLIVVIATIAVGVFSVSPAFAGWTRNASTGVGTGVVGAATSLTTPAGGAATAASATAMNITWTAATAGTVQAQSTYSVAKSAGAGCVNVAATAGTCQITGLAAGTGYSFTIQAKLGTNWGSASSATFSGTTTSAVSSPTISSPAAASPLTVKHNNTATLNIVGTGFVSGLTVSFPGGHFTGGAVTFTDSAHISLTVTAVTNSQGNDRVTVTNPDTGSGSSEASSLVNN